MEVLPCAEPTPEAQNYMYGAFNRQGVTVWAHALNAYAESTQEAPEYMSGAHLLSVVSV